MTGNAVKSIYLTEAAQKEGRKRIMEKDLKDKKPAENGTPKVPWPKLIPAAAVIAALVFSGIKAQGSDANTESVQKADTTVMSASELEKYFGYEEETSVSGASTADNKKSSTPKKTHQKKVRKKQQQKKVQEKELYQNLQKTVAVQPARDLLRHRWQMFRPMDIKTEFTKEPEPDSEEPFVCV